MSVNFLQKRRYWLIPVLIWGAIVGWSLGNSVVSIRAHSESIATEGARNMFRMVEMVRLWNAKTMGIYSPISPKVPPNPHLTIPDRDIETLDGRQLTMLNPAYMTRQIAEVAEQFGIVFHITSLKPIRPANKADAWETRALEQFEAGVEEFGEVVRDPEFSVFRYMAPLLVKPACMKCHEQQGYEIGDIRGGISVSLPYETVLKDDETRVFFSIARHLAVFAVVSVLMLFFLERMRKQLVEIGYIREQQAQVLKDRTAHLQHAIDSLREENELLKQGANGMLRDRP